MHGNITIRNLTHQHGKIPKKCNEQIEAINETIPKEIPTEIVNEITIKIIEDNEKNVSIFHNEPIIVNPDSVPQWTQSNVFKAIEPATWSDQMEVDDQIPNLDLNENPTKPKLEIPIEMVRPKDPVKRSNKTIDQINGGLTFQLIHNNDPAEIYRNYTKSELCHYISTNAKKVFAMEKREQSRKKQYDQYKFNHSKEKLNLVGKIDELQQQLEQASQAANHYDKLYKNEWMITHHYEQRVKELYEENVRLNELYEANNNDRTSRKFIMKIQRQTIRNKDKQINELREKNREFEKIAQQWENPDLTQVFSPETIAIFNSITDEIESETQHSLMDAISSSENSLFEQMILNLDSDHEELLN